jgi:hypothetical protein
MKKERGLTATAPRNEADPQKEPSPLPLPLSSLSESGAEPVESPVFQKTPANLRFMPAISAAMVLLIVGSVYFFSQGSAGTEMTSLVDQKPVQLAGGSAPEESVHETNKSPSVQIPLPSSARSSDETAPLVKKEENGKPHDLLPKKVGNGKSPGLSKGGPQKRKSTGPPVKLLLISRDLKEAVGAIQLQAAQSDGKILEKKEGDSRAKFVFLIPAAHYEPFFLSLQELGLAKKTSKKELPSEDSFKVEVTIE